MLFWKKTELLEGSPAASMFEAVRDTDGLYATKSGGQEWAVHGPQPEKMCQALTEEWSCGTNSCLKDWYAHFDGRI